MDGINQHNEDRKHWSECSKDTQHGVTLQWGIGFLLLVLQVLAMLYAHGRYKVLGKESEFHQVSLHIDVLNYYLYNTKIPYTLHRNSIILHYYVFRQYDVLIVS